jgi:hypothetical protein
VSVESFDIAVEGEKDALSICSSEVEKTVINMLSKVRDLPPLITGHVAHLQNFKVRKYR